jgi:hypothetical protein
MRKPAVLGIAVLLGFAATVRSTTIVAPTFGELVARAEQVVLGRVVARQSTWIASRSGRVIVTDVTFHIERTMKGPIYAERSLEFLGGTIGDETLRVDGMPEFRVGDRDVLFIRDTGRPASPLVGFMHGRFRIVRDTFSGIETVRTHDGRSFASLAEAITPGLLPNPPRALSLDAFLRAVETAIRSSNRP